MLSSTDKKTGTFNHSQNVLGRNIAGRGSALEDTTALGTIALEVDPLASGFPGSFGVCIVPCYSPRRIRRSRESPVDTSFCSSHGPHTDLTRGKLLPAQHSPTTHFQCKTRRGAKIADKMPRMLWAVPPVNPSLGSIGLVGCASCLHLSDKHVME